MPIVPRGATSNVIRFPVELRRAPTLNPRNQAAETDALIAIGAAIAR
jgi:hypothetical protein